uniref:Uncharacterized protein n=1 Tax=Rhizophora mucronata TaxID=61149 RepID=A0A2P2NNK6_RHIMU
MLCNYGSLSGFWIRLQVIHHATDTSGQMDEGNNRLMVDGISQSCFSPLTM